MPSHESTPTPPPADSAETPPDPDAVVADPPTAPGSDVADLVDQMEDRVLHGEPEDAQEAKDASDSSGETPEPEDVDPSGGTPV